MKSNTDLPSNLVLVKGAKPEEDYFNQDLMLPWYQSLPIKVFPHWCGSGLIITVGKHYMFYVNWYKWGVTFKNYRIN